MYPHATPGISITRRPASATQRDVWLDVAAFVGLTERGPVNQAVLLTSWDAFVRAFGRDDDVRQLPRCVRAFFDNGGRRCLVVRTVHTSSDPSQEQARVAITRLPGVRHALDPAHVSYLEAADPGAWGARLSGSVRTLRRRTSPRFGAPATLLSTDPRLVPGVVLRLERWKDDAWVRGTRLIVETQAREGAERALLLDAALDPAWVDAGVLLAQTEHLTWELDVALDGARERHVALELGPQHPRFVDKVLRQESRWLHLRNPPLTSYFVTEPDAIHTFDFALPYLDDQGQPEPLGGTDGASSLTRDDFFAATRALERYEDGGPSLMVKRLSLYPREASLLPPDRGHVLAPPAMVHLSDWMHPQDPDIVASHEMRPWEATLTFAPCDEMTPPDVPQTSPPMYPHLVLGATPALEALGPWRDWCVRRHALLLVDVPPDSDTERLDQWRRTLDSPHVALFGPWLYTGRASALGRRLLPPAAPVCGVLGRLEGLAGVGASPGNQDIAGALGLVVDARLPAADVSFALRLNRLEQTPLGLRLMGSRMTGGDDRTGHISVQRVLAWLYRQLPLDASWAVFETQGQKLWHRLERQVAARLRSLFVAGLLSGRSEDEAFFVRCDAHNNTPYAQEHGRVLVEVGVAVAVPLEFIEIVLVLEREQAAEVRRG